jgi:hypothetical protein
MLDKSTRDCFGAGKTLLSAEGATLGICVCTGVVAALVAALVAAVIDKILFDTPVNPSTIFFSISFKRFCISCISAAVTPLDAKGLPLIPIL